jgi:hypothetical protein
MLTDDDPKIDRAARAFEAALEAEVKKFSPEHFAAALLAYSRPYRDAKQIQWALPFRLAHAIEANCAYMRGHRDLQMLPRHYAAVINVFVDHEDEGPSALMPSGLGLFFLNLHRQQIEIQRSFRRQDFARYFRLFVLSESMSPLNDWLIREKGITCADWMKAAFGAFALAGEELQPVTILPEAIDRRISVRPEALEFYLSTASSTPKAIGCRYRERWDKTPPRYYSMIRSVFFDQPLIQYDSDRYFAPFPSLLFHHAGMGLYSLLLRAPDFNNAFAGAFENYVGFLLREIPAASVYTESQLGGYTVSKRCDFIVETSSEIICIEAKATVFNRNIIIDETIPKDTSTVCLSGAVEQLRQSARDLSQGLFQRLGLTSKGKPVYLLAVTFGDIAFVNAPWYLSTYIDPITQNAVGTTHDASQSDSATPILLAIDDLEILIRLLRSGDTSLAALIAEREISSFEKVGDWDLYLSKQIQSAKSADALLPGAIGDWDAFSNEILPDVVDGYGQPRRQSG